MEEQNSVDKKGNNTFRIIPDRKIHINIPVNNI